MEIFARKSVAELIRIVTIIPPHRREPDAIEAALDVVAIGCDRKSQP